MSFAIILKHNNNNLFIYAIYLLINIKLALILIEFRGFLSPTHANQLNCKEMYIFHLKFVSKITNQP